MINSFLDWLYEWQTLIGAFIGGLVGFVAAVIVARDGRNRDERASAYLVLYDVMQLYTLGKRLKSEVKELNNVSASLYVTSFLMDIYPKLSPLTEISIFRLTHVDVKLAAHLSHFHRLYKLAIDIVEREKEKGSRNTVSASAEYIAQCKKVWELFQRVSEHAVCAANLIDAFILGQGETVFINKFKRRFKKYNYENNCMHLLETGQVRQEPVQATQTDQEVEDTRGV